MTTLYSRAASVLSSVLVAVVALIPAGCGNNEKINSYDAPKSTESGRGPGALLEEANEYRLFGAMFPAETPVWFFKFSGPTEQISKYEADFDKLLASVSLPAGGNPPEFTVPEGWKRGPGRG
ncbi:MAG: hypothetical protein L0241_26855, partial [Planctomycetia bacterium]|nr:hypothetical protein [Planctomycetia bacterium]